MDQIYCSIDICLIRPFTRLKQPIHRDGLLGGSQLMMSFSIRGYGQMKMAIMLSTKPIAFILMYSQGVLYDFPEGHAYIIHDYLQSKYIIWSDKQQKGGIRMFLFSFKTNFQILYINQSSVSQCLVKLSIVKLQDLMPIGDRDSIGGSWRNNNLHTALISQSGWPGDNYILIQGKLQDNMKQKRKKEEIIIQIIGRPCKNGFEALNVIASIDFQAFHILFILRWLMESRLILLTLFAMWAIKYSCGTCVTNDSVYACTAYDSSNTLNVSTTANCGCLTCHHAFLRQGPYACTRCSSVNPAWDHCDANGVYLCMPGYSFNGPNNCQSCQPVMLGCSSCTFAPPVCLACFLTLFFNINHICEPCLNYIALCLYCTSQTKCTACTVATHGVNLTDPVNRNCVPCRSAVLNCSTCTNTTMCLTCDTGLQNLDQGTICNTCWALMPYCSICNSSQECQLCNQTTFGYNYTAAPNECVPCNATLDGCLNCIHITYCTLCINNSFAIEVLSPSDQVCQPCIYFLVGCANCSGPTACIDCIKNGSFLFNPGANTCDPCYTFIPYCLTCTPAHICLSCNASIFAISPVGTCLPCSTFMSFCNLCSSNTSCARCTNGKLVMDQSGCTKIVGCSSVRPLDAISDNCLACDPSNFHPLPVFGRCECIQGWIVGSYCTTVVGCTALLMVNNKSQCISCNGMQKFVLDGATCVCKEHYYFNGTGCLEICGDGYVINHACDDGNKADDDGCSSTCQVENSYVCRNDNSRNPSSICRFAAVVQLSLVSVQKNMVPNTAKITFDITPFSHKIAKMQLMDLVTLTSDSCTIKTIQIIDQQLVINFQYTKNIESQSAQLLIKFDSAYVQSPKYKLDFSMVESSGLSLTYGDSVQIDESYGVIFKALSILTLCIFVLGSIAFKMIGVETLYTIQISWFLMSTSKYFKLFFSNFKALNYSYGQLSLTNEGKVLSSRFGNLGFHSSINDNYFLYAIVNGVIISVYLTGLIYRSILEKSIQNSQQLQEQKDQKDKQGKKKKFSRSPKLRRIDKLLDIFYEWVLFPLLAGFFLHFIHTLLTAQLGTMLFQTPFYYFLSFFITFITTSMIFHAELLKLKQRPAQGPLKNLQQNMYIPYFLVHNLLIFILITLSLINNTNIYIYYSSMGLTVAHIAYVLYKRPYEAGFSNFSLAFNQFTILFSFLWVLSKGTPIDTNQNSLLFLYVSIGAFYSVNLFGLIRSVVVIKEAYTSKKLGLKNLKQRRKVRKHSESIRSNSPKELKLDVQNILIHPRPNANSFSLQSPFLNDNRLSLNRLLNANNRLFQVGFIKERE